VFVIVNEIQCETFHLLYSQIVTKNTEYTAFRW